MAEELSPEEREKLAQEIKILRHEIELVAKDLGTRFAKLETVVSQRVALPTAEVESMKKMGEELAAFRERLTVATRAISEGIPLGMAYRRTYEERLWKERTERGEVEVKESFASARNKFEVLHHLPSCETTVRVTPIYGA